MFYVSIFNYTNFSRLILELAVELENFYHHSDFLTMHLLTKPRLNLTVKS